MTTEAALLAEIWKSPTDRELLGVYADWLAEHGDPTRAEYIQLSLLGKPTPAQRKRREALLNRHRGAWLGEARKFVWTWQESEESPGFVARVQCSMPKLTAGFEHVRALGPRLFVSVSEPKARREVAALAELPLGTLYGMCLFENDAQWITDDLLETIAPRLDGLRALVLHPGEARSSDRGWRAMLPHLDAVEFLDLAMGENPEAWLDEMLASRMPRTLKQLVLPGWLDRALRRRIESSLRSCKVTYRPERRQRFDRATGYYIP